MPAKVRNAERRCPRERTCLVQVWATPDGDRPVPSGHQRYVDPQVSGAILGNRLGEER